MSHQPDHIVQGGDVHQGGLVVQARDLVKQNVGLTSLEFSLGFRDEMPRGSGVNLMFQDALSLSERVLLNSDANLLGLDLLDETQVAVHQVLVPEVFHEPQVQVSKSPRTGDLSSEFKKLLSSL